MQKMYECKNCRKSLPRESYEVKADKRGKDYRATKCKECVFTQKRFHSNEKIERYFSRICVNQRYSHKSGRRGKSPEGFLLNTEDLMKLWEQQGGKCAYSGVLMTTHRDGIGKVDLNASLDRRDPNSGYTLGNVHLVCNRVNIMKHVLDEDMFLWWIKNIAAQRLA